MQSIVLAAYGVWSVAATASAQQMVGASTLTAVRMAFVDFERFRRDASELQDLEQKVFEEIQER